ncbi:MAG: L,D-transpeptidase [Peptococcaceae bacterium]|nr:L,D-transpeptidase [Peptococcaceae bacterium]
MKNTVVSKGDQQGGWIYCPQDISSCQNERQLLDIIRQSLQPNININGSIPFSPLTLIINKKKYTLSVISGNTVLRKYTVGLGADNSTPEGVFYVDKKIMNPDKEVPLISNVFGTRGLQFSNPYYAIHGTNDNQSIGSARSHGCIRLTNHDVNDLYATVPLYTEVIISPTNDDQTFSQLNLQNNPKQFYDTSDNMKEQNKQGDIPWET